jgi:exportin-1
MPAALLDLPPAQFKLVMDSVVWGIKHTMRDIADTGLNSGSRSVDGTDTKSRSR